MASIRIDGWRSSIRFDAAHMIPGHPKCGRLHGHTYALHAEVHGVPAASGFIMDFSDVKRALEAMADRLDHSVLIATKAPLGTMTEDATGVMFECEGKSYRFPREDVRLLPIEFTTAESLVEYVADALLGLVSFPGEVERLDVGLDESYGKGAWTSRLF